MKFDTGDTTVPTTLPFTIDATQSYDPDSPNSGLTYTWKCAGCLTSSGAALLAAEGVTNNTGVMTIPSDSLVNGTTYNLECTVSKDTRSASRTVKLTAS